MSCPNVKVQKGCPYEETGKIRVIKHLLTSEDLYLRSKQVRYEALHRPRLHHLDLTARLGLPEGLEL